MTTDIDALKRAASRLRKYAELTLLVSTNLECEELADALDRMSERMGQEPVAYISRTGHGIFCKPAEYLRPEYRDLEIGGKRVWRALYAAPAAPADDAPKLDIPAGLHPRTADLVLRFASALAHKLHAAEQKYGHSDGWADHGWMDECRAQLLEHVRKGDPRDVAAYCAFLWHHGERTAAPQPTPEDVRDAEKSNFDVELVQCYLYALLAEARRQGSMFPQTGDEQDADADAIHRVCGMARWYAERGQPTAAAIEKLRLRRAAMQQEQAK